MKTLQQCLDDFGASTGCKTWELWVSECLHHPDMVVNKYNELVSTFRVQNQLQVDAALHQLKTKVLAKNWCNNHEMYKTLLP